jgi:mannose-6-phosphate isomerase-like protein (cupin superfamily)
VLAPEAYSLTMVADETSLARRLQEEGFHHTYVWQDGPDAFYSEHVHHEETAHIILSGEMTLIMDGEAKTLCAGERCDVPAGTRHSARMGPRGCRYLIGER